MLSKPLEQYNVNMQAARELETIYIFLESMTTPAIPKKELLRAEFVSILSAFDTYIHDIVRASLKYMYANNIRNSFTTTLITSNSIHDLIGLDAKIREINGYKTFQAPKKIKEVINNLDIVIIWTSLVSGLSDLETRLKLIVQRRNQIAHESDINPTNGLGNKWFIKLDDIHNVIDIISRIVNSIDSKLILNLESRI